MKRIEQKSITIWAALALSMIVLVGCQVTQKTKAAAQSTAYQQVAKDKLGEQVKFSESEDKRFILCQSAPSSDPKNLSFQFLVYDLQAEKIVMERRVSRGYVQWLSNTEVEVFTTPGTMRNDQSRDDFTVVYNVLTGESTEKNDWKK